MDYFHNYHKEHCAQFHLYSEEINLSSDHWIVSRCNGLQLQEIVQLD